MRMIMGHFSWEDAPDWAMYLASSRLGYFTWCEEVPVFHILGYLVSGKGRTRVATVQTWWEKLEEVRNFTPNWVRYSSVSFYGKITWHESKPFLCTDLLAFVGTAKELEVKSTQYVIERPQEDLV